MPLPALQLPSRTLPGPWPPPASVSPQLGKLAASPQDRKLAAAAHQFETLIAQTLLKSARSADLGDDLMGSGGEHVRDQVDRARAEAIARAAPMGIARLMGLKMPEAIKMQTPQAGKMEPQP
ncbi:hypothetical protein [Sandarakinorhabdus sp.]|uniref:hypothetical protein n=1 Tax=Sandarakinorhabdus sp. TaxID=1916663 RepID=UPI00286DF2F5|nr:hypothetical protein [Sandarakinorhabdus sp.]